MMLIEIKKYIFFLLWIAFSQVYSQNKYPQNYFGLPMDIPMLLSGNFGELRPNHFHAGIDIKTPNGEGEKIYAVADGFVSRIKVSTRGYGKVMYVTHPNGYTSVYAHLQKFASDIEAYVKKNQYQQEKFEIELFLSPSEMLVKKGDVIAFSGNTGGSAAPHLHFELRDTKTQKSINPRLFGYKVSDRIPPQVRAIYGYSLNDSSAIAGSEFPQKITFIKQSENVYLANKISAFGNIGFGVQTIDRKDFTHNIYGVYKAEIQVNGITKLSYIFDEMNFSEDNLINTFIDYQIYSQEASRVQLMYRKKSNKLSLYTHTINDGVIEIQDGYTYMVTILLTDFNKNTTQIIIPIEGKIHEVEQKIPQQQGKLLISHRDNYYKTQNARVFVPAHTFYEDMYIDIHQKNDTIKIFPNDVPLAKNYNITIDVTNLLDQSSLDQFFIAWVHPKSKKLSYHKTTKKGNNFSIRTKRMGDFVLAKDTIPPVIEPLNFSFVKNDITHLSELKVKIQDDFSGIAQYRATINGKWILMEYEPKQDILVFNISDIQPITDTRLDFKLQVWDQVGNQQVIEIPLMVKYQDKNNRR